MEEYERLSAKGSRACLAMALPSKITNQLLEEFEFEFEI